MVASDGGPEAEMSCQQAAMPAVVKRRPFKPLHSLHGHPGLAAPLHNGPTAAATAAAGNPRSRFNPPSTATLTCNASTAPDEADETRYYSVMYCPRKPHAKRKGPWSDGLLSVKGRACSLQNMEAKSVAKAMVSGCKDLKDGSTLEIGKFELEVMNGINREHYLAGSCFLPAAPAAPADPEEPSAPAARAKGAAARGRKRGAVENERSSGGASGTAGGGLVMNKRPATTDSRLKQPNEDAVCLNPNQHGKSITKIYLEPYIGLRMRPHQVEGVRFMLESVLEVRVPGCSGCVLADEMGLGKTLQVIALIWTLLKQGPQGRPFLRKVVVLCPSSLVDNWGAEFRKWLGMERLKALVVNSSYSPAEVRGKIADFRHGMVFPVLITSYDLLRRHAPLLSAAAPQLVVCDEGHRLKNCAGNKTITALQQLGCPRKVLLTGTPMQNDLSEFFALLDLVNPGCLGPLPAFRRVFADPIQRSRDRAASEEEVRLGEARSQELQAKAAAFVLRRTAAVNAAYLPPKSEYIVFCRLHPQQAKLYTDFLQSTHVRSLLYSTVAGSTASALTAICHLRKLCLHPALAPFPTAASPAASAAVADEEEEWADGGVAEEEEVEGEGEEGGEGGAGSGGGSGSGVVVDKRNGFRAPGLLPQAPPSAPLSRAAAAAAAAAALKALGGDVWHTSGKLHVLARLLEAVLGASGGGMGGDKVVIVSNFTRALDVIEVMCTARGWKCTRLDGSTEASSRQALVSSFNTGRCGSCCFLLSSKAGGAGLNLVGANRLVLFDPDWNPANDQQAMARVWRDGQSKPVVIYRMLATGSIEEKIFQRQLMKGEVATAVGDSSGANAPSSGGGSSSSKSGTGHFTKEELRELFTLEQATACDTLDLLLRSNSPLSAKWLAAATATAAGASSAAASSAAAATGMGSIGGIADGPLREVAGASEDVTFVYHASTALAGQETSKEGKGVAAASGPCKEEAVQKHSGEESEEEVEEEEGVPVRVVGGGGSGAGGHTQDAEASGDAGDSGAAVARNVLMLGDLGDMDDLDIFASDVF